MKRGILPVGKKTLAGYGFITCVLLALITAPVAIATEWVAPEAISGATIVDGAKAKMLFDKGVIFIDVRKDKDWEAGRIPGAVHLELKKVFNEDSFSKVVKKDQEVVIYCNGVHCKRSPKGVAKAVGWGYAKVYWYRLGFPDWKTGGYPVE
jgi:rhodanese-related sulfurtransferase